MASALAVLGILLAGWGLAGLKKATGVAATGPDPCAKVETNRKLCYDTYFNDIIQKQDPLVAMKRLDQIQQNDSWVQGQCHQIIHVIGHNAYKKYGSVDGAMKYTNELCWSGYYHGVMEAYMAQYNDQQLMAKMPDICHQTSKSYSFDYYNCLHGLGHGVTIRFDNDIMKGLPFCKALVGSWEQQSCYSGAFMQNIIVDGVSHKSVNLKDDDPVYPCDVVEHDEKQPCYLMVTSNILAKNGYDYPGAFRACDNVESEFVGTCYQSMGRDISGNSLLDPAKIVPLCREGAEANRKDCFVGAALNAVYNDRGTTNADKLCAVVPQEYKGDCTAARNQAASTL